MQRSRRILLLVVAAAVVANVWSCGRTPRGPVRVHVISRYDHHPLPGVRVVSTHRGHFVDDRTTDDAGDAVVTAEAGGDLTAHVRRPDGLFSVTRRDVSLGEELTFATFDLTTASRASLQVSVTSQSPLSYGSVVTFPGGAADGPMAGESAQTLAVTVPRRAFVPSDGTFSIFGTALLETRYAFALDIPVSATSATLALTPQPVFPVTVLVTPPESGILPSIYISALRKGVSLANLGLSAAPISATTALAEVYDSAPGDSMLVSYFMPLGTTGGLTVRKTTPIASVVHVDSPDFPARMLTLSFDAQRRSVSWNVSAGPANAAEIVVSCAASDDGPVRWEIVGPAPRAGSGRYSLPGVPSDLQQGLPQCTLVACMMLHDRSDLADPLDVLSRYNPAEGAVDRVSFASEGCRDF